MNTDNGPLEQNSEDLLNEAERLIWALLDDNIEESETKKLESLLKDNEDVRSRYLDCVQLHSDLTLHFNKEKIEGSPKSPVLGSLADIPVMGTDSRPWPPVAE